MPISLLIYFNFYVYLNEGERERKRESSLCYLILKCLQQLGLPESMNPEPQLGECKDSSP